MPLHDHVYACKKIKLDKPLSYTAWKVNEQDAAITEFLSNHNGFTGILKHRCHDFIVHEILNGEIIKLTDLTVPVYTRQLSTESAKTVCSHITAELHQRLTQLSLQKEKVIDDGGDDNCVEIDAESLGKDERTVVHRYVRENFDNLETSYEESNGRKVIVIAPKSRTERRSAWPSDLPDYVHFTLYHDYYGTFEAIEKLGRFTAKSAKNFHYAGTKDKRSIASQRVSIYRQNVSSLMKINDRNQGNPILVGNISFEKEPIALGSADGNRFDVVLRNLEFAKEEDVYEAVNNVTERGFINYFGTQRFGMSTSPSFEIGIAILRRDWLKVIDLILAERIIDFDCSRNDKGKTFNECMRIWRQTRNPDLVLKEFGSKNRLESKILKAIAASAGKNNYHQGFDKIPRLQRMMYLHSYQSLLWNRLASYRIKKYGLSVIPGDLVITHHQDRPDNEDSLKVIKPHIVLPKEVDSFSIYDVVLPIFGSSSILPENDLKDKLIEFLAEEDFDLYTFNSKSKEFNLSGSYRFLLQKPKDVEM